MKKTAQQWIDEMKTPPPNVRFMPTCDWCGISLKPNPEHLGTHRSHDIPTFEIDPMGGVIGGSHKTLRFCKCGDTSVSFCADLWRMHQGRQRYTGR